MDNNVKDAANRRNTVEFLKIGMENAVRKHNRESHVADAMPYIAPAVVIKTPRQIGVYKGGN